MLGPWHFVEICTQTLFQVGLGASSDEQAMGKTMALA